MSSELRLCFAPGDLVPRSLLRTTDPFVQLTHFSLTIAYLIGVSGRNFASNLLVTAQIVCAGSR